MDKQKDKYVRINWVVPKEKTVRTIIAKAGLGRDAVLEQTLLAWKELAKKVKDGKCVLHNKKIGIKDSYIQVEFYNWEKPKTEESYDICLQCLRNTPTQLKLDALKTLGKNPMFTPIITCASTGKCGSFEKSDMPELNCTHIALKFEAIMTKFPEGGGQMDMAPKLYCKRAHPNEVAMPSEEDLDWNVSFAGTTLMLNNIVRNVAGLKKQAEKDPKFREKLVKAFRKGIKSYLQDYEKILGVKLT